MSCLDLLGICIICRDFFLNLHNVTELVGTNLSLI